MHLFVKKYDSQLRANLSQTGAVAINIYDNARRISMDKVSENTPEELPAGALNRGRHDPISNASRLY